MDGLDYETYKEKLYIFLKKHNALEKFEKNLNKKGVNIKFLYDHIQNFNDSLICSFQWSHTKEGSCYWAYLHNFLKNYDIYESAWND